MTAPVLATARATGFDVHGIVGIALVDADSRDATRVSRQLGLSQRTLKDDADITVRFVDRLRTSEPMRYLGLGEVGFADGAFFVLKAKHKSPAKVRIPFHRVGERCEIVCERGLPAVPLLVPILNLTALAKGVLPLHATAFTYRGTGIVATGWSKGGKTETLLAFMQRGATYVGDEWVYVSRDGKTVWGLPEPIRVWDWHLGSLPALAERLQRIDRMRLDALRQVVRTTERIPWPHGLTRLARRALPVLRKQQCVDVEPARLFGAQHCSNVGKVDRLVFVSSHASADVIVRKIDASEIAQRMLFSLQEEARVLLEYYRRYRFAFPERENPLLSRLEPLQQAALERSLAHHPEAYEVRHPYPVALPDLFEAVARHCIEAS